GAALTGTRDFAGAIAELKQALVLSEGSPVLMGHLGMAYGLSGEAAEASRILAELNAFSAREYVPSSAPALALTGIGKNADALAPLDKAYDEHDFALVFLRVAPWFERLRGDARFARLVQRMQIPGPAR